MDINRHALEQFEIHTDVFNKGGSIFFSVHFCVYENQKTQRITASNLMIT